MSALGLRNLAVALLLAAGICGVGSYAFGSLWIALWKSPYSVGGMRLAAVLNPAGAVFLLLAICVFVAFIANRKN